MLRLFKLSNLVIGRVAMPAAAVLLSTIVFTAPAAAVVVISDGFGDADLNNDGTLDSNVQGSVEDTTWIPGRLFIDGMSSEPENTEVATVLDASDTGIRWLQIRGFTSAQGNFPGVGDSKPLLSIVNDPAQLETQPTSTTGGLGRPALDGYAMSWESKGGGSSAAGFFDQRISLGQEVGDQVKVSFDFRLWGDTPNAEELMPPMSELRFGLFQDTDNQLGMTNDFAGRQVDENGEPLSDPTNLLTPGDFSDSFRSAIWGQDEGLFEGRLSNAGLGANADIGSQGDAGWTVGVPIGNNITGPQETNGGGARLREEVQADSILQGTDVEFVARPQNQNPDPFGTPIFDFVNLNTEKAYNIELTLERSTENVDGVDLPAILATLSIFDLADPGTVYSFSGLEQDFQSDSWDYFALRNASSGENEIDFLIDNFKLEIEGSNVPDDLPGDFNMDGSVDAIDYAVWREGLGGEYTSADFTLWLNNYGATASGSGAIATPEPAAMLLLGLMISGLVASRRKP